MPLYICTHVRCLLGRVFLTGLYVLFVALIPRFRMFSAAKVRRLFRSLFISIVEKRFSVPAPYRAEKEQIMFPILLRTMEKRILDGCG